MIDPLLRGVDAALRQGNWAEAAKAAKAVIHHLPKHPQAQAMLGAALLQMNDAGGAISALQIAAQGDRHNAWIQGQLAEAHGLAGNFAEAHAAYRRASRLAPTQWTYALGAAIALARNGRPAEAEPLLRKLSVLHPRELLPLFNLGNVLLELQRAGEAETILRQALLLAPDDIGVLLSLGSALHRQSRFGEAITCYQRGIALDEDSPLPRLNLVSALIDDGRPAEAEAACRELIARAPELAQAYRFLGAARGHQGNLAGAAAAYRQAAAQRDSDMIDRRSHGGALAECGQLHAALRLLATITPATADEHIDLQQLRSTMDLAHGRYGEGWRAYRSRPAYRRLSEKWAARGIVQTLPESLSGLKVVVCREQGLGDELFFYRQLPALRAQGAKITLHASTKIAGMLGRAAVADGVIPDSEPSPAGADVQILCGDLPGALVARPCSELAPRTTAVLPAWPDYPALIRVFDPPPAPSLRLPPLPEALNRIRRLLADAGPPPYIGLTWRAGTAARDQLGADWVLSKDIALPALAGALRGASGTLLALQRHPAAGEIETLSKLIGRPVADFCALNDALEDMLALLALIDDYVGVSNTNMHLRAATGRDARVLVPNPAEWRWMQWGRRSPWFPDFDIYRQSLNGDWSAALAQLSRDLAAS